jgi:hypothetical protein
MRFRNKQMLCLLGSLSLSLTASDVVIVDSKTCCGGEFSYSSVLKMARSLSSEVEVKFASIRIIPSDAERVFSIGTTTEENLHFCFDQAARLRSSSSHAYLFKTPLGVSLHFWDARLGKYLKSVISGRDVFDEVFEGSRIAWIESSRFGPPKVRLVLDELITLKRAMDLTKLLMTDLRVGALFVYLRSDSYYWPNGCSPYSLPLQWRNPIPPGVDAISHDTVDCRIDPSVGKAECFWLHNK